MSDLTYAEARTALEAGLAKAVQIGQPMNVAVVDAGACPMQPTTVIDLSGDEPVLVRRGRGDAARLGLQPHD